MIEIKAPNFSNQENALIGVQLTQSQQQQVDALVKKLNISKREGLAQEIEFCLLNPKNFTACGNDFSRKLNAIRMVILRGDWQTPVGMVCAEAQKQDSQDLAVKELKAKLMDVYAEASHFKKLLAMAKDQARGHFEVILSQANKKIQSIETQLKQITPKEAVLSAC